MENQSQAATPTSPKKKTGSIPILILVSVLLGVIVFAGYYYFLPQDRENKNANTNQVVVNTNVNQDQNANLNRNTNGTFAVNGNSNSNSNTDTAVDTSDWKTYNSADKTLSYKYPQDWFVSGEALVNGAYSWQLTNFDVSTVVARGGLDNGMVKADFSIYPNSDNKTSETIIDCDNDNTEYVTVISCNVTTIGSRVFKRRVQDSEIEGNHRSIELGTVAENNKYFITGMVPAGDQQTAGLAELESVFNTLEID